MFIRREGKCGRSFGEKPRKLDEIITSGMYVRRKEYHIVGFKDWSSK